MVQSPHDVGGAVNVQAGPKGTRCRKQFDERALVGMELRLDPLPQLIDLVVVLACIAAPRATTLSGSRLVSGSC